MTAKKIVKVIRCLVCHHADRAQLEFKHVQGTSLDALAAQFKIERTAIWRHLKNHLTDDDRSTYLAAVPLKELAERAASEGTSVLENLAVVRATLMKSFQLAASVNDRTGTAALAGRLTDCLRTIGNITGELGAMAVGHLTVNNTVNILNSPGFASLQANLLQALAPFPAARAAVVATLQQMDEPDTMKTIEHLPSTQSKATGTAPYETIDN
jgi:hypothetical protein